MILNYRKKSERKKAGNVDNWQVIEKGSFSKEEIINILSDVGYDESMGWQLHQGQMIFLDNNDFTLGVLIL